jgi:hypothetical protein
MPIVTVETFTLIDPRFPSVAVTRWEVLEDGDEIGEVFSDPEDAEEFAREYAERIGGFFDDTPA